MFSPKMWLRGSAHSLSERGRSHNPSPSHGRVYTKFCRSGSNGTNAHRESKSISMGGARSKSYYFVPVQMSVEPGSFA